MKGLKEIDGRYKGSDKHNLEAVSNSTKIETVNKVLLWFIEVSIKLEYVCSTWVHPPKENVPYIEIGHYIIIYNVQ